MSRFAGWRKKRAPARNGKAVSSGGRRSDLENRYFRSPWEANFARYLNLLVANRIIQSWEYEPREYDFGERYRKNRFYKPDFLVHWPDGSETYYEVKGWLDADSLTRLRRMQKHYPMVHLEVVDGKRYRAIASRALAFVPHWESG